MTRRFGLIYTIFSVLVLTVLTVLAIGRLGSARSENLDEAQASYQWLSDSLAGAETTAAMPDALREYASVVPTVRSLVLFDPDRGLRYVWTTDDGILAIDRTALEAFRGFPEYRLDEIRQVRVRDAVGDGLYLDAVYRVLSFEDAYIPLRDSLVSLLAFAFVTVLIVLALGHSSAALGHSSAAPGHSSAAPGHSSAALGHSSAAPGHSSAAQTATAQEAPTSERREASPQPAAKRGSHSSQSGHASPAEVEEPVAAPETHDHRPVEEAEADDLAYEEISLEELATQPSEPGTLFNPVTGLSHHDHLERRLGLELERSAYNDQDLVCVLVRFAQLSGPEAYVERARQILSTFQFEDLCFEYDENTFCVVLPNTELPQGLRQAESFHKRHPDCHIGLSARNGRLVEARRILTETERSLGHAATEQAGVVGFRPDPRKYRQFVTRQMSVDE